MRECPHCHHLNEPGVHQCQHCGHILPHTRQLRLLSPDAVDGLVTVLRALGWTVIFLALVVFVATPIRFLLDVLLLALGGGLLIGAEALKPRLKTLSPTRGAIEIIPPDRDKDGSA